MRIFPILQVNSSTRAATGNFLTFLSAQMTHTTCKIAFWMAFGLSHLNTYTQEGSTVFRDSYKLFGSVRGCFLAQNEPHSFSGSYSPHIKSRDKISNFSLKTASTLY